MYKTMRNAALYTMAVVLPVIGGCAAHQTQDQTTYEIDVKADMERLAQYQRNISKIMDYSAKAVDTMDKASATQKQTHELGHKSLRTAHEIINNMTPKEP
ncbi:hypothetical protein ACFLZB_03135 [Nanoarchaeota archaeon]